MNPDNGPTIYPQPDPQFQPKQITPAPKVRSKGMRRATGGALFAGGLILGSVAASSGGSSTASAPPGAVV